MSRGRLEENRRDSKVDLRAHKLFKTNGDYALDCCPSSTQRHRRTFAINKQGLVIELFQTHNFTQAFYETTCLGGEDQQQQPATAKEKPCQFVDPRLVGHSRCVQQWSYVIAVGRPYGRSNVQFSVDYIRIATGCKCQVSANAVAAVQEEQHGSTTETDLSP